MFAFAKAILITARYLRRIAVSLEAIQELYAQELAAQGIFPAMRKPPGKEDQLEFFYGSTGEDH